MELGVIMVLIVVALAAGGWASVKWLDWLNAFHGQPEGKRIRSTGTWHDGTGF